MQVARLRPERGSFARRMVVADARMSLDPLPPQKSRRRIHWHFLKHLELFLLDCPRFPRLVELCEMPVDLQAAQNLLWPRCRRSLRSIPCARHKCDAGRAEKVPLALDAGLST